MRAVRNPRYGPAERLRLQDVLRPTVGPQTMLVRLCAASVNPFDWHLMRGEPYVVRLIAGLRGPRGGGIPGVDAAGVVEAVGHDVTEFRPGDEVVGSTSGTFAEYVLGSPRHFVAKPARLSFAEAAALPGSGVTALLAVRDYGAASGGQHVLINGAAGGVGTFAVQIATAYGARVTGVCSTGNATLVRALGAEDIIDYTTADFTRTGPYDIVIDNVGNRSLSEMKGALAPGGRLVLVAGGLARKLRTAVSSRLGDKRLASFIAKVTRDRLAGLIDLVEDRAVTPVVGRTYPLAEAPQAIRYVETRHARGKVVITI